MKDLNSRGTCAFVSKVDWINSQSHNFNADHKQLVISVLKPWYPHLSMIHLPVTSMDAWPRL